MITDIYLIDDNPNVDKLLSDLNLSKIKPYFHFYDIGSKKDRKEAYRIKGDFGAKLDPFAVVYDKNTALKAFYTEAGDVINDLIKYLKENDC